jgi:acyl dehydratase
MLFTRRFNVRGVFYQFRSEFVRPIRYGERLRITGAVSDKYIKRNREFVTYEATGVDDDDQVVFRTWRTHALDYITRDKPRSGKGVDSGLLSQ